VSDDVSSWYASDLSTEFIKVKVTATVNGNAAYNPTVDVVYFAFVAREAEPQNSDWVVGRWETETLVTPNGTVHIYRALGLIGPTAKVLARGVYDVYVKIVDNPEIPVRYVGILEVGA
jgi:hypothetical protein